MDSSPAFRSPTHLAEVATAAVRFNLEAGDLLAAAALQPVAQAAWGLVDDPEAAVELAQAVQRAETSLALACGMTGERRFLSDVARYLDDPRETADENMPGPRVADASGGAVDLEDARRLGSASGAYLRAAAALSELAVLCRVAASAIELDACGAEAIVDDVIARVPDLLERAADAYAAVADALSRCTVAADPELAAHVEDLRVGVRALTMEAMHLTPDDEYQTWEGDANNDEGEGADLIEFFADRAETFADKAAFMASCAAGARTRAEQAATGDPGSSD